MRTVSPLFIALTCVAHAHAHTVALWLVVDTPFVNLHGGGGAGGARARAEAIVAGAGEKMVQLDLRVALAGLTLLDAAQQDAMFPVAGHTPEDIGHPRYLQQYGTAFYEWWRGAGVGGTPAAGVAFLLTGLPVTANGETGMVSHPGLTVCTERATGIVRDGGGSTALAAVTLAHELAHQFGVGHDGDPGDAVAAGCAAEGFLMARTTDTAGDAGALRALTWSNCSARALGAAVETLRRERPACLLAEPPGAGASGGGRAAAPPSMLGTTMLLAAALGAAAVPREADDR